MAMEWLCFGIGVLCVCLPTYGDQIPCPGGLSVTDLTCYKVTGPLPNYFIVITATSTLKFGHAGANDYCNRIGHKIIGSNMALGEFASIVGPDLPAIQAITDLKFQDPAELLLFKTTGPMTGDFRAHSTAIVDKWTYTGSATICRSLDAVTPYDSCPADFKGSVTGRCYHISTDAVTFDQAKIDCCNLNSELAKPTDLFYHELNNAWGLRLGNGAAKDNAWVDQQKSTQVTTGSGPTTVTECAKLGYMTTNELLAYGNCNDPQIYICEQDPNKNFVLEECLNPATATTPSSMTTASNMESGNPTTSEALPGTDPSIGIPYTLSADTDPPEKTVGSMKDDHIAQDVLMSIGCTWLIVCMSLAIALTIACRIFTYERLLIMSEEITLLIAHIFILALRRETQNEAVCKAVSVAIHYFSLSHCGFVLVDACHSFTYVFGMRNKGTYIRLPLVFVVCLGLPAVYAGILAATTHPELPSEFVCWMNYDSHFGWTIAMPIALMLLLATTVSNAASRINYYNLPLVPDDKLTSIRVNQTMLMPLSFIDYMHWIICSLTVHYRDWGLTTAALGLTVATGVLFLQRAIVTEEHIIRMSNRWYRKATGWLMKKKALRDKKRTKKGSKGK